MYNLEHPKPGLPLEESPLYQFIDWKLQEINRKIPTLPPGSAPRRSLEAQRRVYSIVRNTALAADQLRTRAASGHESASKPQVLGELPQESPAASGKNPCRVEGSQRTYTQ